MLEHLHISTYVEFAFCQIQYVEKWGCRKDIPSERKYTYSSNNIQFVSQIYYITLQPVYKPIFYFFAQINWDLAVSFKL
jgi:hypothetical protein